MAETLVHSGPCCKSQQLHLSNLWKTAQNIFHSGKSLANDTFIQYVLLVLIRLKDLPTYTVCNLQLYSQIDIIVLRVYLQSTVQRDVKISVSELGGLGATPLISATQPGCEMAWSNRAIRSCANSVPRQAHCKLALYSSALLWAFVQRAVLDRSSRDSSKRAAGLFVTSGPVCNVVMQLLCAEKTRFSL